MAKILINLPVTSRTKMIINFEIKIPVRGASEASSIPLWWLSVCSGSVVALCMTLWWFCSGSAVALCM